MLILRITSHHIWDGFYDVVDHIYSYNFSDDQFTELQHLEHTKNFSRKAVLDYTYALPKCYDSQTP
jgi:hypothetical protein